ncbi:T9SS type A sorting domain-containing protein, partial [Salibacter halophilus]
DGTPDITELPYDSVGSLIGVTNQGYITGFDYYTLFPNLTSIWNCDLKFYDKNWSLQNVVEVKSKLHDSHDTVDMSVNALKASNDFGIFGVGNTGYKASNGWNYYVWYGQINPDDGITVWDTLLPYGPSGQFVASKKNTIITVGSIGASNTGMLIRKINLPSIPFQTEFVSDEQDIPGKVNQPQVTVYPNPSNNYYNLESGKRIKQVSVYDLRGSLIMQKRIESKRSRVQLESAGVYLMRIEDVDGNITTKKVVKW